MEQAVLVHSDFNPQDIANTLWAFATLGQQPSDALMVGMKKHAVLVQGSFSPQANTLWAFATLGQQPSQALVAVITKQAVAVQGDFKPQEIANTLWAFATLGLQPSEELMWRA